MDETRTGRCLSVLGYGSRLRVPAPGTNAAAARRCGDTQRGLDPPPAKCGFTLLGPEEAAPDDAEPSHVLLRLDVKLVEFLCLPSLMRYAQSGKLTFPESALRFVDPDAAQALSSHSTNAKRGQFSATSGSVINAALDALERSTVHVTTVIVPAR